MPAIGTIYAQKRNRTGHTNDRAPVVRQGIPMALYAVGMAITRLKGAAENPPEITDAIAGLEGIEEILKSLEGKPAMTVRAHAPGLAESFRAVHGLLRQAGLDEGGLHDCLHTAERAVKQAQSGLVAA